MASSTLSLSLPVVTKAPRAPIGPKNLRSWRASPSSAYTRSDGAGITQHAARAHHSIVTSSRQRRRAVVVHVATPPQRLGGSFDERSFSAVGQEGSSTSGGDVYSNVVSPPVVVGVGGGGGVLAEEENTKRNKAEEEREMEMSRRGREGAGAGATAHQQDVVIAAEVYDVMEGMPPQMLAAMQGDVESIAAMDLADAVAAESNAKRALAQQALRACDERSALAQQALRASDERLAAIMSKHERLQAEIQTRAAGRLRGTLVTVRARPEEDAVGAGSGAGFEGDHRSDVLLAVELAEAAAEVETALCTVERSRLEDDLAAAHEKIAAAEAFAETLAKDMGDAVAEAAACRRQASEAKERLASAVDERAEKVSELLEEIDHWHKVATRAQEGEHQAREELEKVRAELEAAINIRTEESMGNGDAKNHEQETKKREDGHDGAREGSIPSTRPSTRGAAVAGEEPTAVGTEAEAEDEELKVLKQELEEAKKAAAAADEEMAKLRREAEAAAAAVKDAAERPAEGGLEEAHAAANAAAETASKAVDGAAEKLREAEERASALKASVDEKDAELRAMKKQLEEAKEVSNKCTAAAIEASCRLHKVEAEAEAAKLAAAAVALCAAKEMMMRMREHGVKF